MTKVKFKLFAGFRLAAKNKEVEITPAGKTVGDAIDTLKTEYPDLGALLFQDGGLKQYVNVLHNGQALRGTESLGTAIEDGDEIALFPPVSGG
jgi:molybdopterin synthase sulfur carrier subunit